MPVFMIRDSIILFLLLLNVGLYAQKSIPDSCRNLEPAEFYIGLNTSALPLLIDVRTFDEYRKDRIPGAILVETRAELNEMCDSLDFERPLFLYCEYDDRSQTVCRILSKKGFRNVNNLKGGMLEWRKSPYGIEKKRIRRKRKKPC
jgi:rhodanese-related sulfurtransferase